MEVFLFFLVGAIALGSALGVVLARNPIHSALLLVVTLISIAVYFVMQHAHLVAAVQVIVYASAIVVLFLFVIMLLGVDRIESLRDPVRIQRPAAIVLGLVALAEIVFLAGNHWATGATSSRGSVGAGSDNVRQVAKSIFTTFLWPFEVTAVLLVIAVVGGVVLARRSGRPTDVDVEQGGIEERAQ
jgi:NADH-quinone oxidoreductase subunit J